MMKAIAMKRATLILLAVLLATAGCGRFAFEPLTPGDDDDDGDGGVGDGPRDDGSAPAGWWDGDWHYRMKLSFGDPGQPLQVVPIMVALDGVRFRYANARPAGEDIRFVDADNATVLPYEIERWNAAGDSYLWVQVPQIDQGTGDFIWLYYGNPSAAAAQAPAVWSGYSLAWHLDDNPAGTAPQISDSTANANQGTAAGGIPANAQGAGKVVGAITFDGADDWIAGPGTTTLRAVGDVTLSMWVFRTVAARDEWLCDFSTPMSEQEGNNHLYELSFDSSNNIELQWEYNAGTDEAAQSTTPLTAPINQWTFITVTRSVAANEVRFYQNGALLGAPVSYTNDPTGGTTGSFWFGGMLDTTSSKQPFQGRFDEVRVEARSRGPAWIATQYKSMSDTYVTYGAAETY
jgi:hypothetical protein